MSKAVANNESEITFVERDVRYVDQVLDRLPSQWLRRPRCA